jgi:hypothetical protein
MERPTKPGYYWAKIKDENSGNPTVVEVDDFGIYVIGSELKFYSNDIEEWIAECVPPTHGQSGFG